MHANIELNILNEKLNNAKEAGLIKQHIVNKNDQPILNWKTNITLPQPTQKLDNPTE